MALDADPYRTLGLSRGASLDEVKRAYRKLAKANHPDAAGEAALPRFLAIQAAYEQLVGGPAGKAGKAGMAGTAGTPGPSAAPRRPWQADADRGDATQRAYGGRPRGPRPGTAGATGSAGSTGTTGPSGGARTAGSTGPRGASGQPGTSAGTGRRRPARPSGAGSESDGRGPSGRATGRGANDGARDKGEGPRNKATLGSTSYDGAADQPFEPDWGGASWYGTTSGTYWTLNPKEYADPRKHGPEYQARARRVAKDRAANAAGGTPGAPDTPPTQGPGPEDDGRPIHTSSWWTSTSGDGDTPPIVEPDPTLGRRPPPSQRATPPGAEPPPPDLGQAAADLGRALTDERSGGLSTRVVRAIVGWLPVALGLGWVVGELTGCGRFAATCDGSAGPVVLALQAAALAVLLLVPALASLMTTAAIALLAVAVVAALILTSTGGAADGESRQAALGAVLLLAWLIGLAVAVVRRVRAFRSSARPVS